MKFKVEIEAKDQEEAELIARTLDDPEVHGFVIVVGVLMPLSKRAQERMLRYVGDLVDEDKVEDEEQPR